MVSSFERIRFTESEALGGLHITDGLRIYEENPNPVLRVSNDGIILYYNLGSRWLCDSWECAVGDLVPERYRQRIKHAIQMGKAQSYPEDINGRKVILQIVPVPAQSYVDFFGYYIPPLESITENKHKKGMAHLSQHTYREIEFARAAVHELRNPLTPILAASEMLVNRLDEGTPARLARQINASATELNARIGELFEIAQAEMGTFILDYQSISLEELLNEIVRQTVIGAQNKDVKIVLELNDDLPEIVADRGRLREALGYIIDNTLTRCPAAATINVTGRAVVNSLIIKIKVTCLKIPAVIRDYLSSTDSVQSMNRAHFSTVGLKLTLAKAIIELHGGNIKVESENDSETFTVRIPIDRMLVSLEDSIEDPNHRR